MNAKGLREGIAIVKALATPSAGAARVAAELGLAPTEAGLAQLERVVDVIDAARTIALPILEAGAVVIVPDTDGDAPDWFYEALSDRLGRVGGTTQWADKSYRMAYAAVVWKALRTAAISTPTPGAE